jgi:hypothetical protein
VRKASWFGAAALVVAPFFINSDFGKLLAVAGLLLLIGQAVTLKAWNLVFLNAAGIVGYLFSLIWG